MKKFLLTTLAILLTINTAGCSFDISSFTNSKSSASNTTNTSEATEAETIDIEHIVYRIKNDDYNSGSATSEVGALTTEEYEKYGADITAAFKEEISSEKHYLDTLEHESSGMNIDYITTAWKNRESLYTVISQKTSEDISEYGDYISEMLNLCDCIKSEDEHKDFISYMETSEYSNIISTITNTNNYSSQSNLNTVITTLKYYLNDNNFTSKFSNSYDSYMRDFYNIILDYHNGLVVMFNAINHSSQSELDTGIADATDALTREKTLLAEIQTIQSNTLNALENAYSAYQKLN